MENPVAKKVLLIGWDAADWKIIEALLAEGEMPTLAKFLSEASYGNIATLEPPLSPILWTTIATGKTPDQHGILNFTEPDGENGGIRPVTTTSRKCKAIWNILHQNRKKSNIISWWPSNPAEPINGVMVSNLFQKPQGRLGQPWTLPAGSVHPKRLEDIIAELRVHPDELTEQHILPFIPDAHKIDQEKDKSLVVLSNILAETASVHAAATYVMENEAWDFTAVYYDGIDHFCHPFMKFHPPRISESLPEEKFQLYKDVVKGGYKFHDMMLERLLQLAGEDTTVILMSDHGFHSDHLRPLKLPNEPAGPAYEHREFGIFCIKGPGIKKNHRIYGASLLDVTPTVLTLFGLPAGKDMPGKVLVDVFEERIEPAFIPSWEEVEGDCGMHSEEVRIDPLHSAEALKQLVDLGYIEDPGEDKKKAFEISVRESKYNLAKSFSSFGKYEEALPYFEQLMEESPGSMRFSSHVLFCLDKLNQTEKYREIIDQLKTKYDSLPPSLRFHEANLLLKEKKYREALDILEQLARDHTHLFGINIQLGNVYLKLDRLEQAKDSYRKALEFDPENARAYFGLGLCHIQSKKWEDAIDMLLRSVELVYFNPSAHYHLGEALVECGDKEAAIQAFRVAVSQKPGMTKAHKWLVRLYREQNRKEEAARQEEFLQKRIKKPVTIVSGLPRSGTSMMMQMLKAGGVEVLCDEIRKADTNNPKGYWEYEPVKKLASDASWINLAEGKAVKVIAHLLQHLPADEDYRIVFMERDMDEVLKSQQVMLGKDKKDPYPLALSLTFEKQLKKIKDWLEAQPNIQVLYVNYSEVVENPLSEAGRVAEFLGLENAEAMKHAADKKLYRNANPVWI